MKKTLLLFFMIIQGSISAFSQEVESNEDKHAKIKSYKIAFITDRINLSSDQAAAFWPVYDEFDGKRRENFKKQKNIYRATSNGNLTEKENLENQEKILALKQEDVDLTKVYRVKFLKIISAQQYTQLMDAEHDFHELLMQKLKERQKN